MEARGMTENNLVTILEDRRLAAGKNGKPLGYKAWGESLGIIYTSLFRFAKGQGTLGIEALRALAQIAKANGDEKMIIALAEYALGIELPINSVAVDN